MIINELPALNGIQNGSGRFLTEKGMHMKSLIKQFFSVFGRGFGQETHGTEKSPADRGIARLQS